MVIVLDRVDRCLFVKFHGVAQNAIFEAMDEATDADEGQPACLSAAPLLGPRLNFVGITDESYAAFKAVLTRRGYPFTEAA